MALKGDLMAASLPPSAASKLGFDPLTTVAAAGSSQASATVLAANCTNITSGTGGVIIGLPEEIQLIMNNSGSSISLYPPVGGTINGGTVNAAYSLTNGKATTVFPAGTNFIANQSA